MRNLFFALLFLNVAFLGWAILVDAPATAQAAAPARSLPELALVDAAAPGSTPPAAAAAASTQGPRCRSLGPFVDAAAAAAAAEKLRTHGLSPRNRSVDISASDGYSVYIDQLKDPASQRRALTRLNQAGIQDAKAMSGAGQTDRISLGLFSDQAHAVRRAEQVRQLGFKPVLDLHQRTVSAHWLDIDLEPNEPEPPVAQLRSNVPQGTGAAATPESAIAFSDCPATSAGG